MPGRSFAILLAVAILSTGSFAAYPQPRTYSTHDYFNLELPLGSTWEEAETASLALGAELVERIGELDGHWLLKAGKEDVGKRSISDGGYEPVRRWKKLRSGKSSGLPALHLTSRSDAFHPVISSIRNVAHLPLRQRSKRTYPSFPSQSPSNTSSYVRRDETYLTELNYVQNDLHLADPMIPEQWHLVNTDMPEIEMNVTGLWGRGITGDDVKVCLVDDGLDMHSDDLADNFYAEGSYDFNDHTPLPEPRLSDDNHGTRCAGEIAAVPNDVCGVGVAYTSKVAGVRILSGPISDADEAAALNYEYQKNEIYSCSWGPPDDGRSMDAPDGLILKALVNGVQKGRDGKGSIFVFAAGNGGGLDDQCNFDGYTNSIFSVTIGAVDRKGLHPYYSELCAAMLAVAPSSGSGDHIHTTDVGKDKCSAGHGGTSAAAPLAVGMIALALQVRQDLTWRDVQHLMVQHSVFFNPDDPDWEKTAAGRQFSYKYGYGRVNAGLLVEAAETWKLVKPQAWFDSPAVMLPETEAPAAAAASRRQEEPVEEIEPTTPDEEGQTTPEEAVEPAAPVKPAGSYITEEGVQSTYTISQQMLDDLNFETLEHITVRIWAEHERRGDVEVELLSPNGVISVLARQRRFDDAQSGFNGWKFMSVKHWDENPLGTWTITVKDRTNPDKIGYFKMWSLQLWGQVIDPAKAKTWLLPESDITDEEQIGSDPTATEPTQKPKPTDHLPDDHGTAEGEAHKPGLAEPVDTSTGTNDDHDDASTYPDLVNADEGIFSGIEALKANSKWIGGAALFIMLCSIGAGTFFCIRARRKRKMFGDLGGERGSYRPVSDDLPMGLLDRSKQKLLGKRDNGNSKDLYDAFAYEASEDEDDGLGEAEQLGYHDRFLDDDDEPKTGYTDAPEAEGSTEKAAEKEGKSPEGSSSGSSSWQDAAAPSPRADSPK